MVEDVPVLTGEWKLKCPSYLKKGPATGEGAGMTEEVLQTIKKTLLRLKDDPSHT